MKTKMGMLGFVSFFAIMGGCGAFSAKKMDKSCDKMTFI